MPANIAHLLICNKAVKNLEGEYEKFISILDDKAHKPYLNLGSIGPDLSYYGSMYGGLKSLLFDKSDKPLGVDGWAYHLHSKNPHQFPLTLIELTWKDTWWYSKDWKDEDHFKFAFTCGYLSHMAADQIIHPKVNEIVGPYYRKGDYRQHHRECEIYQDIALFNDLYKKRNGEDFMATPFNKWVDIAPDSSHNAPEWFWYFIQRAFVEVSGVSPKEDEVENWIDGLLLTLRAIKWVGPYKKAYKELMNEGESSEKYKTYFGDFYMELFKRAVKLTSIYWMMVFELYDRPGDFIEIDNDARERFRSVVQDADLSSPLQQNILEDALDAFKQTKVPDKFLLLVNNVKADIDENKIFSINKDEEKSNAKRKYHVW